MKIGVNVRPGNRKLLSTGQSGVVMKKSAQISLTYVRSVSEKYEIPRDYFETQDMHRHIPEGAVPKDGPSAGVTICTALVSALSGTPVRRDVAMTGEITLRGRVLPIGGLREKTMAAYRAGVRTVVIPAENEPDLADIDPVVSGALRFVTAERIDTVLDAALVDRPRKQAPQSLSALPAAAPKQPLGKANSPIPQ